MGQRMVSRSQVTVILHCIACERNLEGYGGSPFSAGYTMTALLAKARGVGWTRKSKQGWFCELCRDKTLPANEGN